MQQKIEEVSKINTNLEIIAKDINNKKRKLDHKHNLLDHVVNETDKSSKEIKKRKRKYAFQISECVAKRRKNNPTKKNTSAKSKCMRRKETMDAAIAIHGGSRINKEPILDGIFDTLGSQFKTECVAEKVLSNKSIGNCVTKKVLTRWNRDFYKSTTNGLRSMNAYYSHNVLGKRKYLNLRKANKQATFKNTSIANFVSYKKLSDIINSVDIGTLIDISELSEKEETLSGMYRPPAPFILRLASFYLKVNKEREDKLKEFNTFKCKDPESFLFAIALGGDGAPGTGMGILISFLNVGERLPSSKEEFLLFGGNVEENSDVVAKYFNILVNDIQYLESKVFDIACSYGTQKVEFKLTELPNDMKMLAFLAGELSNAATYFSTFGNVRRDQANDFKKSFGDSTENHWKPFPYEKRLQDAKKVAEKTEKLSKQNLASSTVHSKLLSFIAKDLESRQYKVPLIQEYIDCAKAEPLHLKNNVIKERFMIIFKICISQSNLGFSKTFRDINCGSVFIKFVSYVRKEMGCNFLANKIVRWFNDNGGKQDKEFTFRFRGKESLLYMRHFPDLIGMLLGQFKEKNIQSRLLEVHLQSIHLRELLSYSVRITDFNLECLSKMKETAKALFKCCCVFDAKVSPSLWTLCNVVPFHAKKCFEFYGFGLGCNTMEGREQKHQMISKYADNTTAQNRWPMIFRHEFIQLVYLRENGYDNVKYKKKSTKFVIKKTKKTCEICNIVLKETEKKCSICHCSLMLKIKEKLSKI